MTDDNIRERIWALLDGVPFKYNNMTIRTSGSNKLLVTGWTNTVNFQNISRATILEELEDLKLMYRDLAYNFKELADIVKNNGLTIEFHIAYDDAGKSSVGLCSEIDGHLNWYIDK